MEFRILGPLEVLDNGLFVPVATGKQRALLASLLLHANRTVPIERLVDDLWGDDPPPTAVKAVQVYVSKLRKVLPDGRLQTRGGGYRLDVGDGELDLARFEGLHAAGRAALEEGRAADAQRDLDAALALWRGPALTEFDEPFAMMEAARLEEVRLTCTEDRVDAELALGRHTALVGELEAVVARHPLRERPREQLMLALYRSGRHAEALATYQAFRRTLGEQLGIDPSPRLRALETQMLRQDEALEGPPRVRIQPVAEWAGSGAPFARATASQRPIGRDDELALLHRDLAATLEGERRIVFVTGEPGVGKTTLVKRFLAEAPEHTAMWIGRGQCVEHRGSGEPYLPVIEAVQRLVRSGGDEAVFELLRKRAPSWLVQMPSLVDEDLVASLQPQVLGVTRERMLREMCEALDALAAERPVALLLEDLQWSDPSTLDLVDAVARRYEPARLLVIGTLRPAASDGGSDALRTFVHGLRVRGLCRVIGLGSLSAESARSYLERRLGGEDLGFEVAAMLHARSRGNPLFMEKLVDAWIESGALTDESGAWAVGGPADLLQRDIPETLRELIEQRLATVDDSAQQVLRSASVAGAEFSAALAAAAADVSLEATEGALERLASDGAFVEATGEERWPDGTIATRYVFTHDLCHEVLSEALPPGRRTRIHRRIGERLAHAYGERADEIAATLAWHFSAGRESGRGVDFLRVAAIQALDRRAPREALAHLGSALELLAELDDDVRLRQEHALSLLHARALIETEGWSSAEAEASLERAVALAAHVSTSERVLALHRLATLHEIRGEYKRSSTLLTESIGLTRGELQPRALVDTHELLACSLFHQGEFARATDHADRGLSYYDGVYANRVTAAFGENPGVSCHGWAALANWYLGRPDRATERADAAVAASTLGTRLHARPMAQAHAAWIAQAAHDTERTRAWSEAARDSASSSGFVYWQAMAQVLHGWAVAREGEVGAGLREIDEGIALSRAIGAWMDDAYYLGLLADASLHAGLVDRGLAAVDEALAGDRTDRSFFFTPELHRLRGELLAAGGNHGAAMESLGHALAEARRLGSPPLELRAAVALGRRTRTPEAGEAVAAALAALPSTVETVDTQEARALLADLGVPEHTSATTTARRPAGEIRYARSGDLNIAFEVTGEGRPDIVLVPGFVSHLEKDWDEPRHARFLERLASIGRLIRFDKRGTGLSDRPPDLPDLETRMDDLRAVMDAADSERATVVGYSEGGPMSILFATTHPERVDRLVLYGTFAKRVGPDDDYPWAIDERTRARNIARMEEEWGFEAHIRLMCPSADEAFARWWGERTRAAASPGAVRVLMEMNSEIDVRDVLSSVHVPTLVVHRRDDPDVLVQEGRYIADRIRDARFVELDGADHLVGIDADQIVDAIEPFLRDDAAPPPATSVRQSERVLATILLADIVSSTETAVRLGDRAWAELLDRHHQLLRQEVAHYAGEVMDSVGDGFMALFDGPARAIRCADAITRRVRTLGLNVRAGVHTGEIERVDGTVRGIAVHVTARISSAAAPGQVLVSATTRDLVAGSGLLLEDVGERRLKGLDEPRRLFAARS